MQPLLDYLFITDIAKRYVTASSAEKVKKK